MQSSTDQIVDEILVVDAQCGSREAFETLVSRWQRRLWAHAYNLTRRPEAAWDITQDSWLDIVRGLSRLKDPAKFGSWAYRIVSHKASDSLHRNGREIWLDEELKAVPKDSPASASDQEQRETADDVHGVLCRLSGHSQVVLNLHYLEGFGVAEIAEILGTPEGTVKSRLHTARSEFRTHWESLVDRPSAPIPATAK
ncbi:MAG: sigma-70 family RNA polymerase sigma factor [Acidobacteriota bacterium]|nr:sigma-70 family RNA polymerase sigma factor [Acidobacteriota bacterium]